MSYSDMLDVCGVVLAAGHGTRMQSNVPKVLHDVHDKPMLAWVLESLQSAGCGEKCLVLGGNVSAFETLARQYEPVTICKQINRLGTADAVAAISDVCEHVTATPGYACGEHVSGAKIQGHHLLIVAGDCPAITGATLNRFVGYCRQKHARLGLIGVNQPDPSGYGRLVLDENNQLLRIVEEKDASSAEKALSLCNSGIIFGQTEFIFELLSDISPSNVTGEYYLTECFRLAREQGEVAAVFQAADNREFAGINNPDQLMQVEAWMKEQRR